MEQSGSNSTPPTDDIPDSHVPAGPHDIFNSTEFQSGTATPETAPVVPPTIPDEPEPVSPDEPASEEEPTEAEPEAPEEEEAEDDTEEPETSNVIPIRGKEEDENPRVLTAAEVEKITGRKGPVAPPVGGPWTADEEGEDTDTTITEEERRNRANARDPEGRRYNGDSYDEGTYIYRDSEPHWMGVSRAVQNTDDTRNIPPRTDSQPEGVYANPELNRDIGEHLDLLADINESYTEAIEHFVQSRYAVEHKDLRGHGHLGPALNIEEAREELRDAFNSYLRVSYEDLQATDAQREIDMRENRAFLRRAHDRLDDALAMTPSPDPDEERRRQRVIAASRAEISQRGRLDGHFRQLLDASPRDIAEMEALEVIELRQRIEAQTARYIEENLATRHMLRTWLDRHPAVNLFTTPVARAIASGATAIFGIYGASKGLLLFDAASGYGSYQFTRAFGEIMGNREAREALSNEDNLTIDAFLDILVRQSRGRRTVKRAGVIAGAAVALGVDVADAITNVPLV